MTVVDMNRMAEELVWLQANPDFEQRPATIREFVGPFYLNIEEKVRPAIMAELETIFGEEVSSDRIAVYALAMITGGIGIGKTTIASIVLPYLAHWVLCLKDPQKFFNLLPGSRIAFMQMSTSGSQAKEVVFGDIKARVEHSPWFQQNYPYDRNFKNQLRFEKDIWILPGDSAETTFEGYNILGGILDEADSHKVTKEKDYAEQGYTTINSRIESRFGAIDRSGKTHSYGFLLVIGQMKRANGFASRKYKEFSKDPKAHAVRMSIWESFGWQRYMNPDGTRDSFWYDTKRHEIIHEILAQVMDSENVIEIPNAYRQSFENAPEKALRDLAGIPPLTGSPFIALSYKIEQARDRWNEMTGNLPCPVAPDGTLAKWFRATNNLKRVCHIDMAYSGDGDALGLAMGHVPEMVERDGELKPFVFIDLLMRIQAPAGREIFIGDVRRLIYELKDGLKFKIVRVTMDGFQSTDTRQQMQKRRIDAEIVSVDRQTLPYEDLREAIYEDRIAFPPYMVHLRTGDDTTTEILVKELSELVDAGNKVDHPEEGSKDVADAVAGVTYSLLGDRSFHRRSLSVDSPTGVQTLPQSGNPLFMGQDPMRAPIPPTTPGPFWTPPSRRRG
jgi:hypothetical protein